MKFIKKWLEKLHIIHTWSEYTNILMIPAQGFQCFPVEESKDDKPIQLFRFDEVTCPSVVRSRRCLHPKCLKKMLSVTKLEMVHMPASNVHVRENKSINQAQVPQTLQ
jgi:hypothetical protein